MYWCKMLLAHWFLLRYIKAFTFESIKILSLIPFFAGLVSGMHAHSWTTFIMYNTTHQQIWKVYFTQYCVKSEHFCKCRFNLSMLCQIFCTSFVQQWSTFVDDFLTQPMMCKVWHRQHACSLFTLLLGKILPSMLCTICDTYIR